MTPRDGTCEISLYNEMYPNSKHTAVVAQTCETELQCTVDKMKGKMKYVRIFRALPGGTATPKMSPASNTQIKKKNDHECDEVGKS